MSDQDSAKVIICGGGVIGASIAYFLSLRNVTATVVERTGVANAASGTSGGFLALDWCQGTPVDTLARRSFALHAELAAALDIDWGYHRLDTLGVAASEQRDFSAYARLAAPSWLGPSAAVHAQIGSEQTTAQVNPAEFTRGLMSAATANRERSDEATALVRDVKMTAMSAKGTSDEKTSTQCRRELSSP